MAAEWPRIFPATVGTGDFSARTDRHRIAGVVTVNGLPAKRRVVIFHRITLEALAAVWSDAITGAWEVSNIPQYLERELFVISFDDTGNDTGNFNAEIADYVSQVTS